MSTGGLSQARLGRLHTIMAGYVERGELPGLVSLVSRRGETHVDAIGLQRVGGRAPLRRDTIFRLSSMTKPLTAVAAMILVEECTLHDARATEACYSAYTGRVAAPFCDAAADASARRTLDV